MNGNDPQRHMARALQLARNGWYTARPNPRVGCVIVRAEQVVGEGWHSRAGEAHAEVNALSAAGDRARGATVYVTLEPCNHQGRTGPCSRALIDAGVSRVVYGMSDPNGAAGGGLQTLRDAGVEVVGPLMEDQAGALNPGFIKRCRDKMPRVTLKVAISLDGRTAMASGESRWVTGAEARRDVQRLRAQSDAIITGIGTVLQDNPALTVRASELDIVNAEEVARLQPLRVIVDSRLRTHAGLRILEPPGSVLVATAVAALTPLGGDNVELCALPDGGGKVDLRRLLALLAARACNDVLVEAGAKLSGEFLRAGLVDQIVVYMAPKLLGSSALPMAQLPFTALEENIPLTITDVRAVGKDWRITATPGIA